MSERFVTRQLSIEDLGKKGPPPHTQDPPASCFGDPSASEVSRRDCCQDKQNNDFAVKT